MVLYMPWDYNSYFEKDPSVKESDIVELKKWAEGPDSSSLIPEDMNEQLILCFHIACNLIMEDTKKCIKTYYSIRKKAPEFFNDRNLNIPVMMESSQTVEYTMLPGTSEEYPIIYHGLFDTSPEKFNFNPCVKMLIMTIDAYVYENGPIRGLQFIFDLKGVKLGHLTRVNLSSLAKYFVYIQEGMPVRIHKMLVLNTIPFFDKVMLLMKPFMKKELASLIYTYPPNMDMKVFHRDVLPKKCLPSNFGGDLPDTATLNKRNMEKLIALKPYFEADEKHRSIYTKKSKKKECIDSKFQDLSFD